MQPEIQKCLFDLKVSIESIYDYLGERGNFEDYKKDKLLRRGIERELEIIGEAANRILKLDPDIKIENARKIVDLRNFVIHSYDKVDDIIIWSIVTRHIPILRGQVEELLSGLS